MGSLDVLSYGFIFFVFVGMLFFWLGQRSSNKKYRKKNSKEADRLYGLAKVYYENGEYLQTVENCSRVASLLESSANMHFLARAYQKLGRRDLALQADEMSLWYAIREKREDILLLFYNACLGYMKERNWELVFYNAEKAVAWLSSRPCKKIIDGINFEEELRFLKIFSGMFHLNREDFIKQTKEDKNWLQKNAQDPHKWDFVEKYQTAQGHLDNALFEVMVDDYLKKNIGLN